MYGSDDDLESSIHDLDHAPSPPDSRDILPALHQSFSQRLPTVASRRHSSPRFVSNVVSGSSPYIANSSSITSTPSKGGRRTIGQSNLSPRSRRLLSLDEGLQFMGPRERFTSENSASRWSIGSSINLLPLTRERNYSTGSISSMPSPPPPPLLANSPSFPPASDPGLMRRPSKRVEFSQNIALPIDIKDDESYNQQAHDSEQETEDTQHNDDSYNSNYIDDESSTGRGGGIEEEKTEWQPVQPNKIREILDDDSDHHRATFRSGNIDLNNKSQQSYNERHNRRHSSNRNLTLSNQHRSGSIEESEDDTSSHHSQRHGRLNSYDYSATALSDVNSLTGDDPDEENTYYDRSESLHANGTGGKRPIIFMGFALPLWFSKRPSWSRVAACVVTQSPCFWCYGCRQPSLTDRTILFRLNILCASLASLQVASFVWLLSVTFSPNIVDRQLDPRQGGTTEFSKEHLVKNVHARIAEVLVNLWNINSFVYILGVEAIIIVAAALFTMRTIRNVNLVGAICYLWCLMWLLPIEVLFVIDLFDYFRVTDVWISHWWRDKTMAWFRRKFCEPQETYNTLCTVPLVNDERQWCLDLYNSTECSNIRNDAQSSLRRFMLSYYYFNAGWGLLLVCLLLLIVNRLESMITKPLIQKSRESNVPAWLALPTIGCLLIGAVYAFAQSSGLNTRSGTSASWIGPLYIASGGLFFLVAMLGWHISAFSILNTRDKRHKIIAINIFILLIAGICVFLTTIFAASITFSINLLHLPLSNGERGKIACFIDQIGSCSDCQSSVRDEEQCPEWSSTDVTHVIQTQAKGSATLSAIFMMYSVAALRFGIGLRRHVTMYQIDYV